MGDITLGQIATWLGFIAGIIASITAIWKIGSEMANNAFAKAISPISHKIDTLNKKIDDLEKKHDESDLSRVKDFLVDFLARIERGEKVDEEELERFWENYDFYHKHGGNSYIHSKLDKLQKSGKL